MAIPDFVNSDGALTKEGQQLQAFIEAQFAGISDDVGSLNGMAGVFKDYYVQVHKLGTMTPERWMRDFAHTYARSAWNIREDVEQQAIKEAAAAAATQANT